MAVASQITCHIAIVRRAVMQGVSRDVTERLSQTRVIFSGASETTPKVRPKFWANVEATLV
jgi:hypothetical protein